MVPFIFLAAISRFVDLSLLLALYVVLYVAKTSPKSTFSKFAVVTSGISLIIVLLIF